LISNVQALRNCPKFLSVIDRVTGSSLLDPLKMVMWMIDVGDSERMKNAVQTLNVRSGTAVDKVFLHECDQNDAEEWLSRFLGKVEEELSHTLAAMEIYKPVATIRRFFTTDTRSTFYCPR
jgi:hypothetical protein